MEPRGLTGSGTAPSALHEASPARLTLIPPDLGCRRSAQIKPTARISAVTYGISAPRAPYGSALPGPRAGQGSQIEGEGLRLLLPISGTFDIDTGIIPASALAALV